MNGSRVTVGEFINSADTEEGCILAGPSFTAFAPPGAVGISNAGGIDPVGNIVGSFYDSNGNQHGYLRLAKSSAAAVTAEAKVQKRRRLRSAVGHAARSSGRGL